eukprot:529235_1
MSLSIKTSLRLNRLISTLDDKQKNCIKTLLDNGLYENATDTLRKMLGMNSIDDVSNDELKTLASILSKPQIPKQSNEPSHQQLIKKSDRILSMHHKLKNNSAFKYKDNMGTLGKMQHEIGRDINALELTGLNQSEINILTRKWAMLHFVLDDIHKDIQKEDLNDFNTFLDNHCKQLIIIQLQTIISIQSILEKKKHY